MTPTWAPEARRSVQAQRFARPFRVRPAAPLQPPDQAPRWTATFRVSTRLSQASRSWESEMRLSLLCTFG